MGAGIPGTGMATLFYIVCALAMPVVELVATVRGRSSWARWRIVAEHTAIAVAMVAVVYATFWLLPVAVLPSAPTFAGLPALAVTVGLFGAYLTLANVLALLVGGGPPLPAPKPRPGAEEPGSGQGPPGRG